MSVIGSNILAGASGQGGYFIDRSLRFRSSASAYLSRTPASSTSSNKKGTFSCWMKVSSNSGTNGGTFLGAADNYFYGQFYNQSLYFGNTTSYMNTDAVFRDYSAWYHVFFVFDTTLATSNDRMQIWVNGVRQTAGGFNTQPSQNSNFEFLNTTQAYEIGRRPAGNYFDGYLTEINFIDGQALDPTYFGEYNADTGVWQPIKYTGTYGTNGFYLNFSDNSTTTTLGYDTSGNGNNWTANNISVTSGVTYDSMTDVPTLTDEDAANYATLNKLSQLSTSTTISNANLSAVIPATSATGKGVGTIAVSFGKWYWETTYTTSNGNYLYVGMGNPSDINPRWLVRGSDGEVFGPTTSGSATAIRFVQGDVIGIALDADNGKWFIRVNGTWQLSADPVAGTGFVHSGLYGELAPRYENATSGATQTIDCNFGQRPFVYTPPTGFKSLNTYNLPDSTIVDGSQYFNTLLYNGTGASASFTGVGFQPDFTWIKSRTAAQTHGLFDSNRGVQKLLQSNSTTKEITSSGYLTSFDSDGFSIGSGTQFLNGSGYTFVAWNWKANGSGVSNNEGTIESTVSANTTAGFSIVTYAGNASGSATVGHGLGVAPDVVIVKRTDVDDGWPVYHSSLGVNKLIELHSTSGEQAATGYWGLVTSDYFGLSAGGSNNRSGSSNVAYCFTAVEGYSKFGSYSGNNSASDGTFVFLGFRPRFLMIKSTSAGTEWVMVDTERSQYNLSDIALYANRAYSETTVSTVNDIDILSNGFKLRNNTGYVNASQTYIYMAFAEVPFKVSLAR